MAMKWKIPLFRIYWDEDDVKRVSSVIRRGMQWSIGPNVEEFEKKVADFIGTKYCVTFNSGTSALHASLLAYEIKGSVIVPSFTFISTVNAPLFVGAKPIFADIENTTYGIDPNNVSNMINKSTAMIPVHYGGLPCAIEELKDLAKNGKIVMIEDAAESFGAKADGKMIGTFGNAAVFSFCQNKIITTGEGGAVVTNDSNIYERLKLVRSHGRYDLTNYFLSTSSPNYTGLGYNFRMSDISAALGLSQLEKIDYLIKMRRANAIYMNKKLSKINGLQLPPEPKDYFHVYQMYSVRLENKQKRDSLMKHLAEAGIMSKVFFEPVHKTRFYSGEFGSISLPMTENISNTILTLPMFPGMQNEEMNYIVEKVCEFFDTEDL